jgi:hypothetical protein
MLEFLSEIFSKNPPRKKFLSDGIQLKTAGGPFFFYWSKLKNPRFQQGII